MLCCVKYVLTHQGLSDDLLSIDDVHALDGFAKHSSGQVVDRLLSVVLFRIDTDTGKGDRHHGLCQSRCRRSSGEGGRLIVGTLSDEDRGRLHYDGQLCVDVYRLTDAEALGSKRD